MPIRKVRSLRERDRAIIARELHVSHERDGALESSRCVAKLLEILDLGPVFASCLALFGDLNPRGLAHGAVQDGAHRGAYDGGHGDDERVKLPVAQQIRDWLAVVFDEEEDEHGGDNDTDAGAGPFVFPLVEHDGEVASGTRKLLLVARLRVRALLTQRLQVLGLL